MRNLKRALSLALAAAMLIGMMVVGASAAEYKDADSIKNAEAVEVLTGIGVVGGSNGSYNPEKTLTRAEFCVMIANALTGGKFDKTLFDGANTPFTDIDHWGAAYIAYCYTAGVIAGTSATTFSPDKTLTAAQAEAILLSALGYNKNGEFAVNGQFSLNVTSWAQQAGLLDGVSVSANAGITRDAMAKILFNALTNTTPVGYSKLAETYYTVGTSAVEGKVLKGDDLKVKNHTNAAYLKTLGYTNFDLVKTTSGTDALGRVTSVWGLDADANGTTEKNIASTVGGAVATFTAATKAADVAKALNGYKLTSTYKVENDTDVSVTVANLVKSNGTSQSNLVVDGSHTVAEAIAALTDNGKLVEVYVDNNNVINNIVTVTYTVSKVTKVVTTTTKTTYTIQGLGDKIDYVDKDATDTIVLAGDVAKGDVVTYAVGTAGKTFVYPTTSITGNQSAKTADGKITVSGTQYTIGSGVTGVAAFNNSKTAAIYYFDQYGFVVDTTSTAASTDYALVIDADATVSETIDGKTPAIQVRVLLADGTVAVKTLAIEKIGGTSALVDTTSSSITSAKTLAAGDYVIKGSTICVYAKDTNEATADIRADELKNKTFGYILDGDSITLQGLANASAANTAESVYANNLGNAVKTGKTSYTVNSTEVLVDKDTKFVVYNVAKKTATVYTGASSLPTSIDAQNSDNGGTGYAVLKTTANNAQLGTASVVFVTTASGLAANTTDNYVYINSSVYTIDLDAKYIYTGVKADGTEVTLAPSSQVTYDGLYAVNADNTVGSALRNTNTDANLVTGAAGNAYGYETAMVVVGNMLKVDNLYFNITEDTQIVYTKPALGLTEVNGNGGFVVLAVKNGSVTSDVAAIFVDRD